jgi:hypothetical protein
MVSQCALHGTTLGAAGYRCMVPAMSGLLRSVRPLVACLLTTVLVLGVNGFVGAIHSAHHMPAPVEAHEHDAHEHGHGQPDPTPVGSPETSCPVADAALHLAAAGVAALPALEFSTPETELAAACPQNAPRLASREPGSGRAPPSLHSRAT